MNYFIVVFYCLARGTHMQQVYDDKGSSCRCQSPQDSITTGLLLLLFNLD